MKSDYLKLQFFLPFVAAFGLHASVHAAILGGTADAINGRAELLFFIYDPVAEASYTKDLGLEVFPYTSGDKFKDNFFVYAQQDSGYQTFFDPLNKDPNFQQFLKASTNVANQVWGVVAAAGNGNTFVNPGDYRYFSTLNHDQWDGVGTNPQFDRLKGTTNQYLFEESQAVYSRWMDDLNRNITGAGPNPYNTHSAKTAAGDFDYQVHGSSYDAKGSGVNLKQFNEGNFGLSGFSQTNKVGTSSFFYYLTISNDDGGLPVLIDEFDNLKHDAYWGLAQDDKGDYILSFTQPSAMTQVASAAGLQRRSWTDFAAAYGQARVLLGKADEFAGWVPRSDAASVSAVPEPATYGLMALGLVLIGARARKRV